MKHFFTAAASAVGIAMLATQHIPAQTPQPSRQSEISIGINQDVGVPLHYAVPDFLALTPDPETVAAAKTMSQVLWDDLTFEREFDLIPRDTYRTIPPATSPTGMATVPGW